MTTEHYTLEDLVRLTAGDKRFEGLRKKCMLCGGTGKIEQLHSFPYFMPHITETVCPPKTGCGGLGYVPVDGEKALAWLLDFVYALPSDDQSLVVGYMVIGKQTHLGSIALASFPWNAEMLRDALADALYQWRLKDAGE